MRATKPMTPGVPHAARLRAYMAGAVVTLGICGVAWRAYALQVDDGDHYAELASHQHAMTVAIPAPRGDVIDSHGRPLAVSADTDSIWANPKAITDVTETAEKLAKLTGDDPRALEAKLGGDRKFVWIARHVTPELAKAVATAKLAGIELAKEPRRWYPSRTIAGPVIGRADIDGIGVDGIELAMNDVLAGKRNTQHALRDARGRRMYDEGVAHSDGGATVQLTLDRSIQAIADDAIAAQVQFTKAKSGVAVVLEVATGKVVALASYPTYDPNNPGTNVAAGRDRPVTDAYEAGSVMKMFSIAAALDDGTVTPETGFDLGNGHVVIGGRPISDVEHEPYGTVAEILKWSSNVGAAKIALRFGRDKLYASLKSFGFGTKTGIELPGEQAGRVRDGGTWRDIELATISYGYGLTVTPLQVAAALAALGNGGRYHQPRVVEQVTDPDGVVLYAGASEERQIVSPKTAAQMMTILTSVFEKGPKGGTAKTLDVEGFACAGKTGTARKWDPVAKEYSTQHYLSSFAGLAPAVDPRLAIVVMVDDPQGDGYYGAKIAGPVFATIASQALRYLGVPGVAPPPKPVPPPRPTPIGPPLSPKGVAAVFDHTMFSPKNWKAMPVIDGPYVDVPRFTELGYAQAIETARSAGIELDATGTGRVVEQQPPPGPAPLGTRVKLRFSDGNSNRARVD